VYILVRLNNKRSMAWVISRDIQVLLFTRTARFMRVCLPTIKSTVSVMRSTQTAMCILAILRRIKNMDAVVFTGLRFPVYRPQIIKISNIIVESGGEDYLQERVCIVRLTVFLDIILRRLL
jgi:hypothetical protein